MKTLERRYSKTDRIIAKAKFSGVIYMRTVLLAAVLGAVIGVLWGFKDKWKIGITDDVMKIVLVAAAVVVVIHFIIQAISVYKKELIVTEDKLVMRYGVLSVKNITIPLDKIITIETRQNLLQRIFDYGSILIIADGVLDDNLMTGVKAADRLSIRILKQVDDAKKQAEYKRIHLQLASLVGKKR